MASYQYELKIPKERIAVLIGKGGETKKLLEESIGIHINVDSKEGDVVISGDDAIRLFDAREVIMAVSRGFNPNVALLLLKPDYVYETVNLMDFVTSQNSLIRVRGRVIGKEGKSRIIIEQITDTFISVFGKTIAIIGTAEKTNLARRAIMSLVQGSRHSSVYKWLEKKAREFDLIEKL